MWCYLVLQKKQRGDFLITELDYSALKRHTNIEDLGDEVKALDDNSLIGQSTGEEALKFGLNVKSKGYNIYVAGAKKDGDKLLSAGGRVLGVNSTAPTT